jgi:uncharacterized protein DUF5679
MGAKRGILSGTSSGVAADATARRDRDMEGGPVAEAYCVRDKQKVEIQNPQRITMKNGKPAIKGTCPICGNSVFRIGA